LTTLLINILKKSSLPIKYTPFTTPIDPNGLEYRSFSFRNAPAFFFLQINRIYADLLEADKVLIYMDNILIAIKDSKSLIEILTEEFKRLVDNKL